MRIVHGASVELHPVLRWMLAARRHRAVIALAVIEVMIYVPIKVGWAVKPGSRADEHAARKPFRSVVTIRRAVIRRNLVIAIRTNRRFTDTDCNLCIRFSRGCEQTTGSDCY